MSITVAKDATRGSLMSTTDKQRFAAHPEA